MVQENLEEELRDSAGHIFAAQQGDIICVYENTSNKIAKSFAAKIREFFSEDVLATANQDTPEFFTHYSLKKDYSKFSKSVEKILDTQNGYMTPKITDKWIRSATRHVSPLTPSKYKEVCDKLSKADIGKCIRSQPICKLSKKEPDIQARELYVFISELQKTIAPNVDLLTDPWLFQSLTHYLDIAVLQELNKPRSKYKGTALNLNMNVASLLGDEFLRFNSRLKPEQKKEITIELEKKDVFSDIGAYRYIKDLLHSKGYKICLDGLTHLTLPLVDCKRLGVDSIKLYWSSELKQDKSIAKELDKFGFSKVILAHCDRADAIEWGKSVGIKLFQGWHVDQLLMPGYSEE